MRGTADFLAESLPEPTCAWGPRQWGGCVQGCRNVAQKGWLLEVASSSVPLPRVAYKGEWPVAPVGILGTATRREGLCAVLRTVAQFSILSPLHLPPRGLAPVAEQPEDEGWAQVVLGPGQPCGLPEPHACLPFCFLPTWIHSPDKGTAWFLFWSPGPHRSAKGMTLVQAVVAQGVGGWGV